MQTKLLNNIVVEIAGEQASEVLNLLIGKKDVNEFLIAKKLKLSINPIRNIFYKLANFGLVSFTRKKDKRKGWYTYFWTINSLKALEVSEKKLREEIENLQSQLKSRETKRFYICKTCNTEVGEENALLHNFTCQECGQVYELNQDAKLLNLLKMRINRFEKQREEVLLEIGKIKEENKKKIDKQERKAKKKKEKEKAARKIVKTKEKKAEEKKKASGKTKIKTKKHKKAKKRR